MTPIEDFRQQRQWLYTLVKDPEGKRFFIPKDRTQYQTEFEAQIERMNAFLEFAGNPHHRFKSVHVAGTSGKGSVTTMIASLLTACGQRTGDHISPYLQICNEKLRIDGQMIAPSQFADLVREFRRLYGHWTAQDQWLKYGEAWVSLTYLWFAQQQPDWAVIETGMGGRYDPTNVLDSALSIITNIDYDHTQSLGETLPEIAWHKAGIIKQGQRVLTAATQPEVLAVIEAEAVEKNAKLRQLEYTLHADQSITVTTPNRLYERIALPFAGQYQRQNAALAIAAVDWLAYDFGFPFTDEAIKRGFATLDYPGRFEVVQENPTVILDGAHNPHKIATLAQSVAAAYPNRKVTVLFGMIVNKDSSGALEALLPIADRFIITEPNVFGKPAQPATKVAEALRTLSDVEGYPNLSISQTPQVQDGITHFLTTAQPDDILLITGSIYLIGEARERWYPQEEILRRLEEGIGRDL